MERRVETVPESGEETSDARAILSWRFAALVRAGYGRRDARELAARREVDLHLAVGLLERGCPVDTALRILR